MMRRQRQIPHNSANVSRRGVSSLEYVLVLGVMIIISSVLLLWFRDLLQSVYELISGWVAWPFL